MAAGVSAGAGRLWGRPPPHALRGDQRHGGGQGSPGPPAHGTSIRLRGQGWGQCPIQLQPTDPSSAHTCHPLSATQTPQSCCAGRELQE